MDIKICKKNKRCGHFLIERLIKELGGLGNNDFKIKSKEEFRNWERKIERLGQEVKNFEKWVVEFFDTERRYPCVDPMQTCWGRRKYLNCLKNLKGKTHLIMSKMEVKK